MVAALVLAAGCAQIAPQSPEIVVRERAQARWDALVKGDFEAAYGYLSPGSRQVESQAAYIGGLRRGFWRTAKVDKVVCAGDQACEVEATIEYEFQGHLTKTPLRESWVREGREWWYVKK